MLLLWQHIPGNVTGNISILKSYSEYPTELLLWTVTLLLLTLMVSAIFERWWHLGSLQRLGYTGPPPNFLLGNLPNFLKASSGFPDGWQKLIDTYGSQVGDVKGKCIAMYVGRRPCIIITDPDVIKRVAIQDFDNFRNRILFEVGGTDKGLLNARDSRWRNARHALAPSFTQAKIKHMSSAMNKSLDVSFAIIEERITEGKPVDFLKLFRGLTMEIICKCGLAFEINAQTDKGQHPLVTSAVNSFKGYGYGDMKKFLISLFPSLRSLFVLLSDFGVPQCEKEVMMCIKEIMHQRMKSHQTGKATDALYFLMKAAQLISEDDKEDTVHPDKNTVHSDKDTVHPDKDTANSVKDTAHSAKDTATNIANSVTNTAQSTCQKNNAANLLQNKTKPKISGIKMVAKSSANGMVAKLLGDEVEIGVSAGEAAAKDSNDKVTTRLPVDKAAVKVSSHNGAIKSSANQAAAKVSGDNVATKLSADEANSKINTDKTAPKISADDAAANAFLMLLAGYETTSVALTFTSYLLAKHPGVQQRLFEEINENVTCEDDVTYEKVGQLQYLDMVINESLRYYPPTGHLVSRDVDKDYEYRGLKFPAKSHIMLPIAYMLHSPDLWEDPNTFNPERFHPDKKKKIHPAVFMPFGLGPRHCVGMRFALLEIKLAVTRLIRRYQLEFCSQTETDLKTRASIIILTPASGELYLNCTRR